MNVFLKQSTLESALEARDEALAIVSHEFKNPLTALRLRLEAVRRLLRDAQTGAAEVDVVQLLGLAQSALGTVTHLTVLADDLSRVADLVPGQLTLSKTWVDLQELSQEVVRDFQEEFGFSEERLALVDAGSVVGFCDRVRVRQLLVNLISNAIKYGGDRSVQVSVTRDSIAGKALLCVQDQGCGIPSAMQTKIFERFDRGEQRVRGDGTSGLGLGLYIVRLIVEAHGGEIQLESEVGQGSIFRIGLPLSE